MLTKEQKSVAGMYALCCIAVEDVCFLTGWEKDSIPQEFYDEVKRVEKDYNDWCNEMSKKIQEQLDKETNEYIESLETI